MLPEPLRDVVDVDDRVVDEDTNAVTKPARTIVFDGRVREVQDEPCGGERHRDRHRADEGAPPIEEERCQDEEQEDAPISAARREVVE